MPQRNPGEPMRDFIERINRLQREASPQNTPTTPPPLRWTRQSALVDIPEGYPNTYTEMMVRDFMPGIQTTGGSRLERVAEFAAEILKERQERPAIDKKVLEAMKVASQKLEEQSYLRDMAMSQELGLSEDRATDYFLLTKRRQQASMPLSELIASDIPVPFSCLSSNQINEWRAAGNKDCKCLQCNIEIPHQWAYFCKNELYCSTHVPEFVICDRCNEVKTGCIVLESYDHKQIPLCKNCLRDGKNCHNCGNDISDAYVGIGVCQACINNPQVGSSDRNFSRSLAWVGNEVGEVLKTTRVVSAEIEGFSSTPRYRNYLAQNVPLEVGISGDGSIQSPPGSSGFEVQTPRIAGSKGEELLGRLVAGLKKIKARINQSCGMHVHIDADGIVPNDRRVYPVSLLQLLKTYVVFEDVLLSFLPYDRRRNRFCRPLRTSFKLMDIDLCETVLDFEKLWYKESTTYDIQEAKGHHYHSSRYFGVNFHCLLGQGHLEIRYHSPTLNANKILQWANLHALIVDAAAQTRFSQDFFLEAQATTSLKEKTEMLFQIINLAPKSRAYFKQRQQLFASKKAEEEGLEKMVAMSPFERHTARASTMVRVDSPMIEIDEVSNNLEY